MDGETDYIIDLVVSQTAYKQGTLLEKYLTLTPRDFEMLLRSSPPKSSSEPQKEAYRYSMVRKCTYHTKFFQ